MKPKSVMTFRALLRLVVLCLTAMGAGCVSTHHAPTDRPFVVLLGTAQDAGIPQAGSYAHQGWTHAGHRRLGTCLGLIDPRSNKCWLIEATPDFRQQLYLLQGHATSGQRPVLAGVFLTHAHIGHYTGLMFLGHESMGARSLPVYAMPQMRAFLESNGPWDQLIRYQNISIKALQAEQAVRLADDLTVRPFLVPHRQEYSEVVGYRIDGPNKSLLFIPDIDSWRELDAQGIAIEDLIAAVDVAYLDGTFYHNGEIPGRDMSGFPHPLITDSLKRFSRLPEQHRAKIRFIHLNHTNPAQTPGSEAARKVRRAGMAIASELEIFPL